MAPEPGVFTIRNMVMEHDEVTNVLDFEVHLGVEFVDLRFANSGVRKHLYQTRNRPLDQVYAG